jgi:hypothetical protein
MLRQCHRSLSSGSIPRQRCGALPLQETAHTCGKETEYKMSKEAAGNSLFIRRTLRSQPGGSRSPQPGCAAPGPGRESPLPPPLQFGAAPTRSKSSSRLQLVTGSGLEATRGGTKHPMASARTARGEMLLIHTPDPSRFSPLLITWQLVPVGEAVLYAPLPTGSWLAPPPPLWGDYVLGLRPR